MKRNEALKVVDYLVRTPNIKKHLLAAEVAMTTLYDYFDEKGKIDVGTRVDWGIVGLLHDADYEATDKDLDRHTDMVTEKISGRAPHEVIEAVRGHCDKAARDTLMAKSIYAADELTGLIVAAALVRPDKKLEGLTAESVIKRFKEPAFAKGADRDQIKTCDSELGIPLKEFTEIVLNAMKTISKDLGL
jgi:predicted hydrolase (HD superfamily)